MTDTPTEDLFFDNYNNLTIWGIILEEPDIFKEQAIKSLTGSGGMRIRRADSTDTVYVLGTSDIYDFLERLEEYEKK